MDRSPGCVSNILHDLGCEPLEDRRSHHRLNMLYKIKHGIVDIDASDILRPSDKHTRGGQRLYQSLYMQLARYTRGPSTPIPSKKGTEVYISQLIRFARGSSHVADFNGRNKSLTAKLVQQGYRYHKFRKTFSKFYSRHYELIFKFNVGLKKHFCIKAYRNRNFMVT